MVRTRSHIEEVDALPLDSCVVHLPSLEKTGGTRSFCPGRVGDHGIEDHAHVITPARKETAIERNGAVNVFIDEIGCQGIFLSFDFAMSWEVSKAYFEDSFESLNGQLDMRSNTRSISTTSQESMDSKWNRKDLPRASSSMAGSCVQVRSNWAGMRA